MLCVQLMMILIKVSDISNEARPMEVAEPWLDCLLQEFYNQVNQEKECSLQRERKTWTQVIVCPFLSSERCGEARGSPRHPLHGPG